MRDGGTSDRYFIKGNNFVNRGNAIGNDADKNSEKPPARKLLLSGGAEIVEVSVKSQNNVELDGKEIINKVLIKSPADVLYYSGHGSRYGYLLSVNPEVNAQELLESWRRNSHTLKALIIAGCSVISIHKVEGEKHNYYFNKDDRNGPGMQWAKLLESKGGPVKSICGSWAAAPTDNQKGGPGGNEIAARMGQKLAEDPNANQADNWMKIHYDIYIDESVPDKTTYAAALKNNSFLYIEYSGTNKIEEENIDP